MAGLKVKTLDGADEEAAGVLYGGGSSGGLLSMSIFEGRERLGQAEPKTKSAP